MEEHKIREIFNFKYRKKNILLKVYKNYVGSCDKCYFQQCAAATCTMSSKTIRNRTGACRAFHREDNTHIIFKEVNNKKEK